jgi:peptide/nickel transport system permease protein
MMIKLLKQPQFIIGFLFILGLLFLSFKWPSLLDVNRTDALKLLDYKYDDEGNLLGTPPFSPSEEPPFGTDTYGKQIFYQVIDGAKYTILIALGIAFMRILISLTISLLNPNAKLSFLNDIVQATLYIPTAVLAFIFMSALIVKQSSSLEPMSLIKFIVLQGLVLVGIGMPPLISTFSEEIKSILRKDYIVNTFALGSRKPYVYYKHVLPELSVKLFLIFAQQAVQVLILLAHLGVLAIFLGGSRRLVLGDPMTPEIVHIPLAGEWAGIIGMFFNKLQVAPWIILIPLAFFTVTIFALNLMMKGLQNTMEAKKS